MNTVHEWLAAPWVNPLGRTLLHFLWQGAALGALAWVALRLTHKCSAKARYLLAGLLMLALPVMPVMTFLILSNAPIVAAPILAEPSARAAKVSTPLTEFNPENPRLNSPVTPEPFPAAKAASPIISVTSASKLSWWPTFIAAGSRWIVPFWLMGVLGMAARLGLGWLRIQRWQRSATPTLDAVLLASFQRLTEKFGLCARVRLLISKTIPGPVTYGWLRPAVLLPAQMLTGLPPELLEALLAHELAHIARRDYLANLVQSAIEVVLFYHPVVWWLGARLREIREECCDELAVQACGDRLTYARALESLAQLQLAAEPAAAASGGNLLARITRIVGRAPETSGSSALGTLLFITAIAGFIVCLSVSSSKAQDKTPPASQLAQGKASSPVKNLSVSTLTPNPESYFDHAIRMCVGEFRSEAYLELAAALQAVPKDEAIGWLKKWADYDVSVPTEGETQAQKFDREDKHQTSAQYETQVLVLCQMLFEPQPGAYTRPGLIMRDCVGGTNLALWPRGPITFIDNIPFYVSHISSPWGFAYSGPPEETAGDYLHYCLDHMDWSKQRYQAVTPEQLKNALDKLLTTTTWVKPLTEEETQFLSDQVQPPVYTPVRPMSLDWEAGWGEGGRWGAGGQAFPPGRDHYLMSLPTALIITVSNGYYPFKYTVTWSDETKDEVISTTRAKLGLWQQTSREYADRQDKILSDTTFLFDDTVHAVGTTLTVEVEDSQKQKVSTHAIVRELDTIEIYKPDTLTTTADSGRPATIATQAASASTHVPAPWNGNFTYHGTNTLNLGTGAMTMNAQAQSVQISVPPPTATDSLFGIGNTDTGSWQSNINYFTPFHDSYPPFLAPIPNPAPAPIPNAVPTPIPTTIPSAMAIPIPIIISPAQTMLVLNGTGNQTSAAANATSLAASTPVVNPPPSPTPTQRQLYNYEGTFQDSSTAPATAAPVQGNGTLTYAASTSARQMPDSLKILTTDALTGEKLPAPTANLTVPPVTTDSLTANGGTSRSALLTSGRNTYTLNGTQTGTLTLKGADSTNHPVILEIEAYYLEYASALKFQPPADEAELRKYLDKFVQTKGVNLISAPRMPTMAAHEATVTVGQLGAQLNGAGYTTQPIGVSMNIQWQWSGDDIEYSGKESLTTLEKVSGSPGDVVQHSDLTEMVLHGKTALDQVNVFDLGEGKQPGRSRATVLVFQLVAPGDKPAEPNNNSSPPNPSSGNPPPSTLTGSKMQLLPSTVIAPAGEYEATLPNGKKVPVTLEKPSVFIAAN